MSVEPGSAFGPYEILSPLGAGGMGEVYKAKDTRLDRTVAIKVLPEGFSHDPARRERFEREARAVSRLNHPHVCTLHDVGHHEGIDFIVMEYIEGKTLADRLKNGALPVEQAVEYGIQIADALDKAHRQGVVHRDLKPGNVMLTKSGVKLLDFGLAKFQRDGGGFSEISEGSEEETGHKPLTGEGAIVGTLQYMAPEQLEGKDVDTRTDLFAFGAVLYEMVTGRTAFEGKSQASLIGAILKDEPPPISQLRSMTPPRLDRIVQRCLAKDPEERWQSARDLVLEMKSQPADAAAPTAASRRGVLLFAAAAGLILAAALGGYFMRAHPIPGPLTHLSINVPSKDSNGIALSPDGRVLAYTDVEGGISKVYLRNLAGTDVSPVEGSEGAVFPFFSPEGQWLGFIVGDEVKKVPRSGGLPSTIGTMPTRVMGATWGEDGAILLGSPVGLWRLREGGAQPELIAPVEGGEGSRADPETVPSERAVLYTAVFGGSTTRIGVASLDTGESHTLIDGYFPRYSPTGHFLYEDQGTLWATRFHAQRMEVTGSPIAIQEGVVSSSRGAQYALSTNGTLVYGQGSASELVWIERTGEPTPIPGGSGLTHLRVSAGGRRTAGVMDSDIWILDLSRHTRERLTFEGSNSGPLWTPDGERIVFRATRGDEPAIYWKNADGSGTAERLLSGEAVALSWTPDGSVLGFQQPDTTGQLDIWLLAMGANRAPEKFIGGPFNELAPNFSPDGRVLAYVSDESGRQEVYAQPHPEPGPRVRVSTEGGVGPVWSRDGTELFYAKGQQLFAVSVQTGPKLEFGTPRLLFEGPYAFDALDGHPHYDVAPDGRFAASTLATSDPTFDVILNFDQELERLLPEDE
jgi:serine/threonine protein kinase/Tol biopolymer transport system component